MLIARSGAESVYAWHLPMKCAGYIRGRPNRSRHCKKAQSLWPQVQTTTSHLPGPNLVRLPWATATHTEDTTIPRQPQMNVQHSTNPNAFVIPSGPSPEDIPGFPMPPGFEGDRTPASSASRGGLAPLRPASNGARLSGPISAATLAPPVAAQPFRSEPLTQRPARRPHHNNAPQPHPGVTTQANQGGQQGGMPTTGRLSVSMLPGVSTDQFATGYLDPFLVMFPDHALSTRRGLTLA